MTLRVLEPETWVEFAACRGIAVREETSDHFFPTSESQMTDLAKEKCPTCPVRAQCLDFALRNHIENGIWGGLTEKERRKLVRRFKFAAPPDPEILEEAVDFI